MLRSVNFQKLMTQSLLAATMVLAPVAAFAAADLDKPAPAFSATGADGKTINLESYRGKTVVLEWTNADCPFVKKHYESNNIQKLQEEAAAQGVVWLQVISSAPGAQGYVDGATAIKLNQFRDAKPAGVVLDADGKIGKAYGAQTTPHLYIVDAKGQLVYKGGIDSIPSADKGDISKADNYVRDALKEIAAGKKISNPSTKPYGCSVKYQA